MEANEFGDKTRDEVEISYSLQLGSVQMNLGAQVFKNVVRPKKGTMYDLRFLIELAF